jgi:hypothetical protein
MLCIKDKLFWTDNFIWTMHEKYLLSVVFSNKSLSTLQNIFSYSYIESKPTIIKMKNRGKTKKISLLMP